MMMHWRFVVRFASIPVAHVIDVSVDERERMRRSEMTTGYLRVLYQGQVCTQDMHSKGA